MKYWVLIVAYLSLSLSGFAQERADFKALKKFYKRLASQSSPLRFIQASDGLGEWQQIALIRHGKPIIAREGWFSLAEARQFIKDYDQTSVALFDAPPFALAPQELSYIYSSPLSRSRHTASLIFGDTLKRLIRQDFREFERRIIGIPWVALPIKVWLVPARLFWILGLNQKGIESYREAKARSRQVADFLSQDAQAQGKTLLVSHGFLNKSLASDLQKIGWVKVHDGGKGYLSVKVFCKKRPRASDK